MKALFFCCAISAAVVIGISACGGDSGNTSSNSNTGRMTSNAMNSMSNAANTVANTLANAANSVANTVSHATTSGPEDFLKEAGQGGMAEVELGKLASANAKNAEVKKFGQMMVTDHSAANKELEALAGKKNVTVPKDLGTHQSTLDKLKGLKGDDFDKEYVEEMVDDHETDVAAFQKQADTATDPDVKAFAAKTLPVLKKHLEAIKAIQAKMNK